MKNEKFVIQKIKEENFELKRTLDKNNEAFKGLQENMKVLLVDNEKLNNLITKKASDVDFWKTKLQGYEENQENYINELKKQLEINYEKASELNKQQINYDIESLKITLKDLENQNSILNKENEEAKEYISELNSKYSDLLIRIENYERNFIEKSIYEKEKNEWLNQFKKLENNIMQLLSENEKVLSLYNETASDIGNWKIKYQNLENNHEEHVKQLKKTWEISQNNNIELSLKESSLRFKNEIERVIYEKENLLKYIKIIEAKNNDITEKYTILSQRSDQQKKRIIQLEAEKERVEVYQGKIREIEEQHLLEIERVKAELFYERESEQIINLQEKVEVLSEELSKMNRALDERNLEVMQYQEKLQTYEEFHEMKMREFQSKLEVKSQHLREEKESYISDLERKIEYQQEEKIKYIEEIEKWRGNSLELEKKLNNIAIMENKLEVMSNQNLALNRTLKGQMEENMYWKGQVFENEKYSQYIAEMEHKIRYLMAENERLNKIIIMRCRDMLNN